MANDAEGVMKKRDGLMWSWRAHNKVNARLAEAEARGDPTGAGDPAVPKVQWPPADVCPACHGAAEWNDEEVFKFLVGYFHGLGAPRPRPSARGAGHNAGAGERLTGYWTAGAKATHAAGRDDGGAGAMTPLYVGLAVAAVPVVALVALLGVGSTGGRTFQGYWQRHINKTRAAFRRRNGGSPTTLGGSGGAGRGGYERML